MAHESPINAEFMARLRERFSPETRSLVAVSGGLDSVVLLHILVAAGYSNLHVAHFNHLLRGEESDRDEQFVSELASQFGLPFSSGRGDVSRFAEERGLSIETAAREMRYRWLGELAREETLSSVFLAHHADDQIETVLINLFRGTGTRGISGMSEIAKRTRNGHELTLLRPLLSLSRSDLENYLAKNTEVSYREDSSNRSNEFLRNRVRNLLIPQIDEVFSRDISNAVLRASRLASEDEAYIQSQVAHIDLETEGRLEVSGLRRLPPALRKRYLAAWMKQSGIRNLSEAVIVRVEEVLHSDARPAKTNLPGGFHLRRKSGMLFIEKES